MLVLLYIRSLKYLVTSSTGFNAHLTYIAHFLEPVAQALNRMQHNNILPTLLVPIKRCFCKKVTSFLVLHAQ